MGSYQKNIKEHVLTSNVILDKTRSWGWRSIKSNECATGGVLQWLLNMAFTWKMESEATNLSDECAATTVALTCGVQPPQTFRTVKRESTKILERFSGQEWFRFRCTLAPCWGYQLQRCSIQMEDQKPPLPSFTLKFGSNY